MKVKKSRLRKGISVILAATMALSACAVGFTAFAGDDRDLSTVQKIEQAIFADTITASGAESNLELLKDDLKVAFKGLTNEQKETLSPLAIAKIYKMGYQSATGSAAQKPLGAIEALGAYTPKVQAGIDMLSVISGVTPMEIDGTDYLAKLNYFPFDKTYTSGKVTYTVDVQKAIMEKAIELYKTADPYSLEIADCFYASASYTYSMGGYQFNATNPMLTAIVKYANVVAAKDKTATEKQAYIFNTLGIATGKSYKLMETINEYTLPKYTDAAKAYSTSDKGDAAKATFKGIVGDAFAKTVYSYSLENKVSSLSATILASGEQLVSVANVWKEVVTQYQPIFDADVTAPIIQKINDAAKDLSGITTSAEAQKIFADAGFNTLSYAQKQMVLAAAKDAVDKILVVVKTVDTRAFRESVDAYKMPTSITATNKEQIAKDSAAFVAVYNALKSDFNAVYTSKANLQQFIKDNYASTEEKYQKIVNFGNDIGVLDVETAIKNFDMSQEQGAELNEKITALKTAYNALSTAHKNYFVANRQAEYAKYNKIIGLWSLSSDKNIHVAPDVVDSQLGSKENAEMVTGAVSSVITQLVNDLVKPMLNAGDKDLNTAITTLFTNEMVTGAVKTVVPALYNLIKSMNMEVDVFGTKYKLEDLFQFTPEGIADRVDSIAQFSDANVVAKLKALGNTPDDFAKMAPDFDWGVKDGDYDSFMTALLAVIGRSLNTGLAGGLIISSWTTEMIVGSYKATPDQSAVDSSTVKQGGYNSFIIPLLEALGATDLPTGLEYAMMANDEENKNQPGNAMYDKRNTSQTLMMDNILRPVVDILYKQVLQPAAKDPGNYILENLPNLIYHLEDGCIFNNLMATLDANPIPMANLNVGDTIRTALGGDLSLGLIFDMLTKEKVAEDGTVTPPLLDLAGLGIDLELKDITGLAGAGTAQTVKTAKNVDGTIKIVGDKTKVVSYLVETIIPALDVNAMIVDLISTEIKGSFVKVEVPAYPHDGKMDKKVIKNLISGLEETIGGFVNIEDSINGALATNEMAGTAIKGIYQAIEGLLNKSLNVTIVPIAPSRVAEMLGEAKEFKAIAAELKDSPTWADVSFTIKNDDGEVIKQVDMGFKDGDLNGFVKTIIASLRPIVELVQSTDLLTNQTVDGEIVYGLYETLVIPVLESLGLKPVATSETFTKNFNKLYAKDNNAGLDYILNTILKPVFTLLEKFEKDPIATVMDVLPNIAYAIKYNPSTAFIGNLLLGDKNLADVLNGFIGGLLPGIKLNAINLDALISCGEIKDVNSMSALNKTYKTVVADRADTFVTAFYYLFDTINTGDNLKLIKDMLADVEMEAGLKTVVDGLVNSLFDMTREEALCTLGATFSDWTCPNAEDENGGGNKGTNGKTPGTGDTAISAIAVVSVLFTAGAAIVLLRKKKTIAE